MKELLISLIEKINAILQPIKKVLDFNESGKGMAIGKVSEIDGLEIDWETKFNKKNYLRDNIYISKDAIDSTRDGPSANEYSPSIVYRDKNGKQIGYIQASHRTNGNIRMAVVASRNVDGANKTSGIWMDVDASGNSVYGMTKPAKFLEALGINDYIVEQGTSGIWTYRKWNSGIAECWGYWTSQNASGSRRALEVNLPFAFSSTNYNVGVSLGQNGGTISGTFGDFDASANTQHTTSKFIFSWIGSSTYTVSFYFDVKGRWK